MVKKDNGASWELNPGPLACFVFLFRQEVAQSENHTTRPHAHVSVGVLNKGLNYEGIKRGRSILKMQLDGEWQNMKKKEGKEILLCVTVDSFLWIS